MSAQKRISLPPVVRLVGDVDHPDFGEAVALLWAEARIDEAATEPPELVVIAQSRPGMICVQQLELLRREAPLAGMVSLLGSWCEGELRTGRPLPGVQRLYWYEFPAWWRRQLALRGAGRCPEWARPAGAPPLIRHRGPEPDFESAAGSTRGLIVVRSPVSEIAITVADVLQRADYSTVVQFVGRTASQVRRAAAGVWDGSQLSASEAADLHQFCRTLACESAPVIALFDFPRRDTVDSAHYLGAAAVMGKPWRNSDLTDSLQAVIRGGRRRRAA